MLITPEVMVHNPVDTIKTTGAAFQMNNANIMF